VMWSNYATRVLPGVVSYSSELEYWQATQRMYQCMFTTLAGLVKHSLRGRTAVHWDYDEQAFSVVLQPRFLPCSEEISRIRGILRPTNPA
jgi:hypothetical protein